MKQFALVLSALAAGGGILGGKEVVLGKHTFTLPEGFEVEKVAGPPLVDRPIVADFDEEGNLYVADSAGVNDKVQKQLEERPHRIVRLTDRDRDGVFDSSTVFADKMMFPEGLLWHDGAVYCAAPPSIWKLEDLDGDGVADRRTEWFNVGTLTGCANDLHGPYLGPAGWIYWTKGAFAQLDLEMADGSRLTDKAAHIFRARPDGSGLESFAAGGMDNPVDVTFGAAGDVFFSSTFLVQPGNGRRDGLIHAVYGSVFPKRHGVIDGLPRTGDLMPALAHLGPAAPAGLTTYQSGAFGKTSRGNLFSALFNMRKVMRHELTPRGASYRSQDSDFLVSDQVDFHPTDVLEDADGSLLVLDTGGWYKLCCPTSVIAKPEVLGAIYRVSRTGATVPSDPRGRELDWASLAVAELLTDPRWTVRQRAISRLATRGDAALPVLEKMLSPDSDREAALAAVWTAARMRTRESAGLLRRALSHQDKTVQQAGAYVCGLERDPKRLPDLLRLLESSHQAVQREAATALGRLGDPSATEALLRCSARGSEDGAPNDRHLNHALTFALIEIGDAAGIRRVLGEGEALTPDAIARAVWSLDQMEDGSLSGGEALRALRNGAKVGAILKRRPEWQSEIARHYKETLLEGSPKDRSGSLFGEDGGAFLQLPEVAKMVSDLLLREDLGSAVLAGIQSDLEGARFGTSRPLPDQLVPGLVNAVLSSKTSPEMFPTSLLRGLQESQMTVAVEEYLGAKAASPDDRDQMLAIEILAACGKGLSDPAFEAVRKSLTGEGWHEAARILSRCKLTAEQKAVLTGVLPEAGPGQLGLLLEPYRSGGSAELGQLLARGLARSPAVRSVPEEVIATIAGAYPESARQAILDARPTNESAAQLQARLDELDSGLPAGDRLRGHQVFKSSRAACATCHRIAYDGGEVGPDLTRIGAIRSRRDLLEAIVAPSASYARGYEPMIVTTEGGVVQMGRLEHREGAIALTDAAGRTTEIDSAEIRSIELAPASLMPPGIDQTLRKQELADLLTFLESLK